MPCPYFLNEMFLLVDLIGLGFPVYFMLELLVEIGISIETLA